MVKKKYQSKRMSLHKKYKIARKVTDHKRKERKKERMGGNKRKDPGIPNNWPFKEDLLQQVEQARLAELESQRQAREQSKEDKKERKRLAAAARKASVPALTPLSVEMQAKKDLKDAVQSADMVFIVLDARDPQGSRSLSLEDGLIGKGNKKVVLVLNKIDLIAPDVAEKWVNYLRRFHATIPVRALNKTVVDMKKKTRAAKGHQALYDRTQALQEMRDNGSVAPLRLLLDELSRQATGAESKAAPLRIAVVGYANVGKSTLINSLKKRLITHVAPSATSTKRAQTVEYNDKVTLIDTPALDAAYSDASSAIMRHGIADVFIEDAVPAVETLIQRCDASNLMQTLQIPLFRNHEEFIARLAVKRNILRRGGEPDILATARLFLTSLGNGSIPATCLPPTKSKSRFDLPEWYQQLDLAKLPALETELYTTNPPADLKRRRVLEFKATAVSHAAGDTTEYDLVLGQLPENDGLTSESDDEEGEDAEMSGDDEEEEELEEADE